MRLITGGSGFLGVALARVLVDEGISVRVFDLKRSSHLPERIEFREGDIRDGESVMQACEGVSHVYHLAALLPQRKAPKDVMQAVHIGGTENILKACVANRVERLVFLSSSEVYGKMLAIPCPESAPKHPLGEYGRNKVQCEALCEKYAAENGLKISMLRPPTLIGPGMREESIELMMKGLRRGVIFPIIGTGQNRVQALDIVDCANVVYLCGEAPEAVGQVFNVGCEAVPTMLEIARAMNKHAGGKAKILKIPSTVGINLLRFLNLFGVSPMRPEHFELLTSDFVMDTVKIKRTLGWAPARSYLESATAMYDWYTKELSNA